MIERELLARAFKGALLLDMLSPGWQSRVDLDILDMGVDAECVLGQVYGEYNEGREALGLRTSWSAADFGFDRRRYDQGIQAPEADYEGIQGAWVALLS